MPDDAMEIWRREIETVQPSTAPASVAPPGGGGAARRPALSLAPAHVIRGWAIGTFLTFMAILLLEARGESLLPLAVGVVVAAAGLELTQTRSAGKALVAAGAALFGGAVVAAVLIPILALLEFIDCVSSWLADC